MSSDFTTFNRDVTNLFFTEDNLRKLFPMFKRWKGEVIATIYSGILSILGKDIYNIESIVLEDSSNQYFNVIFRGNEFRYILNFSCSARKTASEQIHEYLTRIEEIAPVDDKLYSKSLHEIPPLTVDIILKQLSANDTGSSTIDFMTFTGDTSKRKGIHIYNVGNGNKHKRKNVSDNVGYNNYEVVTVGLIFEHA